MCACVYVSTPGLLKTIHVKRSMNNQSNKSYCFSVSLIDTDGRGLSNEARRKLLPKKSLFAVPLHGKSPLTSCTLLTRRSASILKVGVPCGLRSLYKTSL